MTAGIYVFLYYLIWFFYIPFLSSALSPWTLLITIPALIQLFRAKHQQLTYGDLDYIDCLKFVCYAYMSGCANITFMYIWFIYIMIMFQSIRSLLVQKYGNVEEGKKIWEDFISDHINKSNNKFTIW